MIRIHSHFGWKVAFAICAAAFLGLLLAEGSDPLSGGFIEMGRIASALLAVITLGGILTDGYKIKRNTTDG